MESSFAVSVLPNLTLYLYIVQGMNSNFRFQLMGSEGILEITGNYRDTLVIRDELGKLEGTEDMMKKNITITITNYLYFSVGPNCLKRRLTIHNF